MYEEWIDIQCVNGKYQISNYGNVRNTRTRKIISPFNNKGYLRVQMYFEGKPVKKLVHILVAEHFIGPKPFDSAQVNHRDLNRKNNHVENLEWASGSENVRHAIKLRNGRLEQLQEQMRSIIKEHGSVGAEASKKPVMQISLSTGSVIRVFPSAREASKETGISYKKISAVCTGKRLSKGLFTWRFVGKEGATTIETTS